MSTATGALEWIEFPMGLVDLYRTPVLLHGAKDAMLVDAAFTLSSGHRLVQHIKETGKKLRAVFITCADPDYYFGLGPVHAAFPDARVWATATTAAVIRETAAHKIDVWKPQLGAECPPTLTDIVFPTPWTESEILLEGVSIQIQTAQQPNRFNLWIDSRQTILGGVQLVSGIHVWMADTPTAAERTAWSLSLKEMAARQPVAAVPGHRAPGGPVGIAAIDFTRGYLDAFEEELPRAKNAAALIAIMKSRYPQLAMEFVLELGAKVCMREASWP